MGGQRQGWACGRILDRRLHLAGTDTGHHLLLALDIVTNTCGAQFFVQRIVAQLLVQLFSSAHAVGQVFVALLDAFERLARADQA